MTYRNRERHRDTQTQRQRYRDTEMQRYRDTERERDASHVNVGHSLLFSCGHGPARLQAVAASDGEVGGAKDREPHSHRFGVARGHAKYCGRLVQH